MGFAKICRMVRVGNGAFRPGPTCSQLPGPPAFIAWFWDMAQIMASPWDTKEPKGDQPFPRIELDGHLDVLSRTGWFCPLPSITWVGTFRGSPPQGPGNIFAVTARFHFCGFCGPEHLPLYHLRWETGPGFPDPVLWSRVPGAPGRPPASGLGLENLVSRATLAIFPCWPVSVNMKF